MFEIGKKAVTLYNFGIETIQWGINYPKRGDILTIEGIEEHPIPEYLMLYFVEYRGLPLCSKNFAPIEEISEITFNEIMEVIQVPTNITVRQLTCYEKSNHLRKLSQCDHIRKRNLTDNESCRVELQVSL